MNNRKLPFDQYQRYQAVADIISNLNLRPGFSLADIGAGIEKLAGQFFENCQITYIDKSFLGNTPEKNVIAENINDLNIEKDSYDIIVSIDAFEHINKDNRQLVIEKLYSGAKKYLIIAAPFKTTLVPSFETLSNEIYHMLSGENNKWLVEHMKYGLPDLDQTLQQLERLKCTTAVLGNGNIFRWIKMLNFNLLAFADENNQEIAETVNRSYNKHIYKIDHDEPTYRKIILVSKTKHNAKDIINNITQNYNKMSTALGIQKWEEIQAEIDEFNIKYAKEKRNDIDSKNIRHIEKKIDTIRQAGNNKDKYISEYNLLLESKQFIIEKLERTMVKLNTAISDSADERHILEEQLRQKQKNNDILSRKIAENQKKAIVKEEEVHFLNGTLKQKQNTIEALNLEVAKINDDTNRYKYNVQKLLVQNKELQGIIQAINKSTSWKITWPIRLFSNGIKYCLRIIAHITYKVLRGGYHSGLIPGKVKVKMVVWLLNHAPFLFSGRVAYEDLATPKPEMVDKPSVKKSDVELIEIAKSLKFCTIEEPVASIIIPIYGKIEYTLNCLKSIMRIKARYSFEILIINDNSPDQSVEILENIPGIRIENNEINLGFLRSSNIGAKIARGKYLIFLNNDTEVLNRWLDELVGTIEKWPEIGLVGSKLIYPDGRLQEAGGIIWQDGTGWNYGRFDDPDKPEYNYLREVDYCSGASICIPKQLFQNVGGFDERYVPAYYEDADLAFAVREYGKKVVYQPISKLIHFEGITCGTDMDCGHKKFQIQNAKKFISKWRAQLKKHQKSGSNVLLARQRNLKQRLLIVDECTPTPDKDAGSVTAFFFMKILSDLGYQITFIPSSNYLMMEKYTIDLQRFGIECLYAPYVNDVNKHLSERGPLYDIVLLYRANCANRYIDNVKKYCKNAFVIFDTVDLHYLRLERQALLEKSEKLKQEACKYKEIELSVINVADATIVLSAEEKRILDKEIGDNSKIHEIPLILDVPGCKNGYENRAGIVFVGGFTHMPNVDAIIYFIEKIYPIIKSQIMDIVFYVVGSNAPKEIIKYNNDKDIEILGYVEELDDILNRCKLSVVPVRYGAGIKGKIGTSLSYGLPVVSTSVGAEGMGLANGHDVLIEDQPAEFADAVVRLYNDKVLWEKLSKRGLRFVNNKYSENMGTKKIEALLHSHFQNIPN